MRTAVRPCLSLHIPRKEVIPNVELDVRRANFLAKYELLDQLGSGTFSRVCRGRQRTSGQCFALKCVDTTDEEIKSSLRNEYEIMRSITNRAIVHVFALEELEGTSYLVMELCGGGTVQRRVQEEGAFGESVAGPLFTDLLYGLSYLHCKRIVHCDMKPENLVLPNDEPSSLKIVDFNSARRIGHRAQSSLLTHRGTRSHNAPEIEFGRDWNERVDVWASGFILYFILCGALPFRIESRAAARTLLKHQLPPVEWHGFAVPICNLIEQCLRVNHHDRPPAMELMQHPALSSQPGKGIGRRGSSARVLEAESAAETYFFAWLPACGFLSLKAMQFHDYSLTSEPLHLRDHDEQDLQPPDLRQGAFIEDPLCSRMRSKRSASKQSATGRQSPEETLQDLAEAKFARAVTMSEKARTSSTSDSSMTDMCARTSSGDDDVVWERAWSG